MQMTTTPDRSAPPQRGSQPFQAHRRPECAGRACRDDADDERAGHARPEDADDEPLGAEPEGAIIFLISASCPSNIWTFSARSSSEGLPAALPTGDRLRPELPAASLFASHNSFLLSSNAFVAATNANRASCSTFHAALTPLWAPRTPP